MVQHGNSSARNDRLLDPRAIADVPFESEHQAKSAAYVRRAIAAAHAHAASTIALSSAAVVHGLPLVSGVPEHVHLISDVGRAGLRRGVVIHRLGLAEAEIIEGEPPVTSPARTWVDITRTSSLADSLAVGDAGVRLGLFTVATLQELADEASGRGCRRLRAASRIVNGMRESPLESWSAATFHRWSLPMPHEQVVIHDHRGEPIGRVDFLWDDVRVIGEADGALKYREPSDLYREKRREDRLRSLGYQVIRWGWSDLAHPRDLFETLWKAVGHSERPRRPVPEYVPRRHSSSSFQASSSSTNMARVTTWGP